MMHIYVQKAIRKRKCITCRDIIQPKEACLVIRPYYDKTYRSVCGSCLISFLKEVTELKLEELKHDKNIKRVSNEFREIKRV